MAREDWEVEGAEDAVDPGEMPVANEEAEGEEGDEFPDAQILVDEQTGQHFLAFEIEPPEEDEEEK